ncbi:MAG: hypothetical protein FWG79_09005 [Bacteroidales bacterium]|nr:hypothetical protein [Bacteroidales bacterium]
MLSRLFKTLVILALSANVCLAQTITLLGKVVDSDGIALPLARMQLVAAGDTVHRHVGENGVFSFRIVPSRVQLITSHVGFETDVRTFDALRDTAIDIVLNFSGMELEGVAVTARSRAMVRSTEMGAITLNTEKLSELPSIMGSPDLISILQLLPGVQHAGEANGHLYVRGADPGHNLMLYNTTPVYGTSHLLGIFPFYNADHIDRIQFDKSGQETQAGNRLGATVQCLSPDEKPETLSIKGNVGVLASQITVSSPVGKKAGVVVSGRQTYVDQIITPLLNSSSKGENSLENFGYAFSDVNLTLMLRPSKKHSIDVNAFWSGDRFTIGDKRMHLDGKMRWGNQLASATWNYQLGQDISLSNEMYFSRYANFLNLGQAGLDVQVDSEVADWGFNSGADFKMFDIPFATGIQYANYRVKPQDLSSETLPVPSELAEVTTSQLVSIYLHGKPKLNRYFSLDAGLRLGLYNDYGRNGKADWRLEPRIGLNFSDDHQWAAYLSYARKAQRLHLITTSSVGFPTDFWIASSQGVPVSLADNFSTGANYRISPQMELTAGLFYSRMNNLVHYPFNILQFNDMTHFGDDIYVGKGKARGAEFMLRKTGQLSGWISYTLSKSDRQFDGIDGGETFPSKFDRRHNFSAAAIYKIHKRWTASLTQIFTSGNRFTTPTSWYFISNTPVKEYGKHNNAIMPSYIRTDVSVDFHLSKVSHRESVLNVSIYNVFAVNNPIYVILDVRSSESGNMMQVVARYKTMYKLLPSVSWRFRF